MKKTLTVFLSAMLAAAILTAIAFAQVAYQRVYTTDLALKDKTWSQTKGVITSSGNANAASYAVTFYGYGQVVYYAISGGTVAVTANFLASGTTSQFDPALVPAETLLDITATGMTVSSPTRVTWTLQAQAAAPTTVYYSIGGWR